jgi:DNA repair exonuclease SbcCD ATPase subunit
MKEIIYKTLKGQNFLSIGNEEIHIDIKNGLNLITGRDVDNPERKNGCGKSTISELFYYALYGTTVRNINKEFVINTETKGKGNIELVFDVKTPKGTKTYKIVRVLKPSSVALYQITDKEEDISKDSIANTNKYICDLISSNEEISKSCDILSLSDSVSFMAQKPDKKRKFIEDIFSLEILGLMLKDLKELIKNNKSEITIIETRIAEITESKDTLKRQYENLLKQKEERETKLIKRKEELEKEIETLKKQIEEMVIPSIGELLDEKKKYETASTKVDEEITKLNGAIAILKNKIGDNKKYIEDNNNIKLGTKCEHCKQDIPEDSSYLKEINHNCSEQIKRWEEILIEKNDELVRKKDLKSKIKLKIDKIVDEVSSIRLKETEKKTNEAKLHRISAELRGVEEDLKSEIKSMDSFDEDIANIEKKLKDNTDKLATLNQEKSDLEICKFVLGEEGIKSVIVKKLLDLLNASIQKYITGLGMKITCKFDEYFEEHITNPKGKKLSYWNLSGGERRTVDLACAWAFKDTKRKISGVTSNVEFLDEIFDSAFDERGLDLFIELLKERIHKEKLSCYAISHRKETLKHIDGEIIVLEKENSVTRRVIEDN